MTSRLTLTSIPFSQISERLKTTLYDLWWLCILVHCLGGPPSRTATSMTGIGLLCHVSNKAGTDGKLWVNLVTFSVPI